MLYLLKYCQYHDPKVTNAGKIADGIIQRTFWGGKNNEIKQLTTILISNLNCKSRYPHLKTGLDKLLTITITITITRAYHMKCSKSIR